MSEQLNIHKEGNEPQPLPFIKNKCWIIDQNIKPNYNSIEGNTGENFYRFIDFIWEGMEALLLKGKLLIFELHEN